MFAGLLDDAAIFPPGNLPLAEAVRAHLAHHAAPYADLVGPLVVGLRDLPALAAATADLPEDSIAVAVTVPSPAEIVAAAERTGGTRGVLLAALEVAVPDEMPAADVVPALGAAVGVLVEKNSLFVAERSTNQREFHRPSGETPPTIYLELPRDSRRPALIAALATLAAQPRPLDDQLQQRRQPQPATSTYRAKLRTGGVRADLHPDEAELAAAIVALVGAGVPFKATAGLHHAVRNTDPQTGFEQHGFLNVLAATDAALAGANETDIRAVLAVRDGPHLASRIAALTPAATADLRAAFRSFGTCSITDPVTELAGLQLLPKCEVSPPEVSDSALRGVPSRPSTCEGAGAGLP